MELIDPQRPKVEKSLRWLQKAVFMAVGAYALYLLLHLALGGRDFAAAKAQDVPLSFHHENIGEGPLALGGHKTFCPVKGLPEEVAILGINLRPDAPREKVALQLGLKSSEQTKEITMGEAFWVKETSPGIFAFSEEGGIQIIPSLLDRGIVRLDLEKGFFIGKSMRSSLKEEIDYEGAFQKAEVHLPDLLLSKYGGPEYRELSDKVQIDLGTNVCFVKEGDLLVWADQMWQEGASLERPLAKVTNVTSSSVEVDIWDASGFREVHVAIPFKNVHQMPLRAEEVITSLRPKAAREITCLLGKRRVVLKAGDWWLKTQTGFKNIRRMQDIEDVLAHRLQGELFIFDEITNDKGRMTIQGTHFDATHTHMQPLMITATVEKKVGAAARKRGSWKKGRQSDEIMIQQKKIIEEGS
ncbi:MAG: hypothetical protein JSR58_01355 [Verrucomicrobia bacterium]|nr:hypothetical protein [Verrucomicrobiota bacterium]